MTEALKRALFELNEVCISAAEMNWDGYGGSKAHPLSRGYAERFLKMFPFNCVAPPTIAIDPDGEVSFSWERAPRLVFSISFAPDGKMHYAGLYGPNSMHGVEILKDEVSPLILDSINQVALAVTK